MSHPRRLRFAAITLCTNERMTENIDLYSRLGYVEIERKTEESYQRVYMRKSLIDRLPGAGA